MLSQLDNRPGSQVDNLRLNQLHSPQGVQQVSPPYNQRGSHQVSHRANRLVDPRVSLVPQLHPQLVSLLASHQLSHPVTQHRNQRLHLVLDLLPPQRMLQLHTTWSSM